jgi:hypothetical protein
MHLDEEAKKAFEAMSQSQNNLLRKMNEVQNSKSKDRARPYLLTESSEVK